MKKTPVIDLFAGPGGLGEGFSQAGFDIRLSIEMDPIACETLKIRKFFHSLNNKNPNQDYYDFVRRKITLEKLKESYSELWKNAESRVLNAELGNKKHDKLINERLDEILKIKMNSSLLVDLRVRRIHLQEDQEGWVQVS